METGTTIQETIDNLPYPFYYLIGRPTFPNDQGEQLLNAIYDNLGLAATDGSLLPGTDKGTYSYVLTTSYKSDKKIKGSQYTPITTPMSSLISEQYGWMGLLLTIYVLTKHFDFPLEYERTLQIAIDNGTQVSRNKQETAHGIKLRHYVRPDWDVWAMTKAIEQLLPIKLDTYHIKSHQDKNKKKNDLPYDVQLNIEADQLTKDQYSKPYTNFYKPTLSTTGVIYRDSGGREITNLKQHITTSTHEKPLIEYIKRKRNWTDTTFNKIHWDGLEQCQRQKKNRHRIKCTQMLHNWQHVGRQKIQFGETRSEEYKCPFGCGEEETQMHYIQCPKIIGTTAHRQELKKLQESLRQIQTKDSIYCLITYAALNIGEMDGYTTMEHDATCTAFEEQSEIGWVTFFQGYISRSWETAQYDHDKDVDSNTRLNWTGKLIQHLHGYTKNMWELRNHRVHGETIQEARNITVEKLRRRAMALYDHPDRQYIPFDASFNAFKQPKAHILRKRLQALEIWIDLAEECLRLHREEALKLNMPRCKYKKKIEEYMIPTRHNT